MLVLRSTCATNLAVLCNPLVLNLPERNRPEETERLAAVFRWLSENSGWLLILDNADTPEAAAEVEKTLPQLQGGRVIITSRIADWSPAVQTAELEVLDEEDAAAFLLERTEPKRKKTLADPREAAALARDLGGLALALEQAGAYVAKNGCLSRNTGSAGSRAKRRCSPGTTKADELPEQRGRDVANHD